MSSVSPGWIAVLLSLVARNAVGDTERETAAVEPGPAPRDESPDAGDEAEGGDRSYLLPAAEVVGINLALNAFCRWGLNEDYAEVTWETMGENVDGWRWDTEGFKVNQLGHAYQGSAFFTSARSSGLGGWMSFAYAFGGSLLWEVFGETTPPSINDQITTPVAGMILGEALFQLHLRAVTRLEPGLWREVAAFATAPMAGFNRALFHERFLPPQSEMTWSAYAELQLGAAGLADDEERIAAGHGNGRLVLGVPGSAGLRLSRPLGHMDFRAALSLGERSAGYLFTRGTLWGRPFGHHAAGGLWGLFGQYDYLVQTSLRASVVGIGAGTSAAWRAGAATFGGTAILSGVPYGAGSVHPQPDESLDQHFGQGGAGTLEGFAIWADRARLEIAARDYLVAGTIDSSGWENIAFVAGAVSFRIHDLHGLGVGAQWTRRRSRFEDTTTSRDAESLVLTYQLLGYGMGGPD